MNEMRDEEAQWSQSENLCHLINCCAVARSIRIRIKKSLLNVM